ncbi:MAG: hypothetical protein R3E09_06780 [Novosphingobium sp.]
MDSFEDISREYWDDDRSVQSVTSFERCRAYFDETMRGFRLRIGLGTTDVNLAHRSLTIGSSQIDFIRLCCDKGFRVDQPDEFDYYYLKLVLEGRCEIVTGDDVVVVKENEAAAVNPFGSLSVSWQGVCEQVLIRLDRNALEQTLAEELDIEVVDPIRFAPVAVPNEESRATSALVNLLRCDADEAGVFRTWRFYRHFERLFIWQRCNAFRTTIQSS